MDYMDIFFGDDVIDTYNIFLKDEPMWYADLYRSDGSFYQIRVIIIDGYCKIHLYMRNNKIVNDFNNPLFQKKPQIGRWWNKQMLYMLSDYDSLNKIDLNTTQLDFTARLSKRITNGYNIKQMSIPSDSWVRIKKKMDDAGLCTGGVIG